MKYRSTRGAQNEISSLDAVLQGIAADGGLYMPVSFDKSFDYRELLALSVTEMTERILAYFLDDFDDIPGIVSRAYTGKFDAADLTPLVQVGDRYVLELFHGPTSAFKDVALSVLPQLLSGAKKKSGMEEEIVILTATSGDTGKAAMEGFHDVPGVKIIVFYPYGGVSRVQELQMTTQEGGNVRACAVRGNFDQAQTGVKQIFTRVKKEGLPEGMKAVLSSANSINIGRLVPQIVYYFKAYADLVKRGVIKAGDPVDYTVPTGNFGDILAGYFAKMLGLPVGKLICAANANNVLADFITTGTYDKNRAFLKTVSPSMDILVSSNLERLLYLLSDCDAAYTADLMKQLSESGVYTVKPEILDKLQETFLTGSADDEKTKETIGRVFKDYGYLLDTHTAVGWAVASECGVSDRPNVVLATASPYKFPAAVAEAIGLAAEGDEFELMQRLSEKSGTAVPKNLAGLSEKEVRLKDVTDIDDMYDYVLRVIHE